MIKQERLDQLFGGYKAEWLRGDIFKLFKEPSYFGELKDNRPFVLQGGRGTGKTTVLRGLSYQGQYEILEKDMDRFDANNFIGIYYRANTNHVRAFGGKGVAEDIWTTLFEHYINLVMCWEIMRFLKWHRDLRQDEKMFGERACKRIAKSLCLQEATDFDTLYDTIDDALLDFQSDLNNVADGDYPRRSMCSVPIQLITAEVRNLPQFADKTIYLLIDEYENFSDSQQESMNTMIKHINDNYTFKIGVREMGWRVKHTHNQYESLNQPADYYMYKIEEQFTDANADQFESFARDICNQRLRMLIEDYILLGEDFTIDQALESLTIEDEAVKLRVDRNPLYLRFLDCEKKMNLDLDIHPLYKFTIAFWADSHHTDMELEIEDYLENTTSWNTRYDNYKYGMLFKITRNRGGVTIPKYYCGWSTFIKLANGNIRYLMGLVHQAYSHMLKNNNGEIMSRVSAECQTIAAKNIGWTYLTELEGSCGKGVQLTQMVQSLGTIFKSLARDAEKSAPELVQFDFDEELSPAAQELIKYGVMNLALVRMSANKLSSTSIKDFQYALHPIFAPYFDFSFRRKRKFTLTSSEFMGFVETPEETVNKFLKRRSVKTETETVVPTQLSLFDSEMFWRNEE